MYHTIFSTGYFIDCNKLGAASFMPMAPIPALIEWVKKGACYEYQASSLPCRHDATLGSMSMKIIHLNKRWTATNLVFKRTDNK